MLSVFIILLLFGAGCDRMKKSTPLIDAIRAKDKAKIAALLKKGANINAAVRDGTTPLIAAAATCNWPLLKLLVDKGAKVNVYDASKKSPMMYALYHCSGGKKANTRYKVVRYLLEKGATKKDAIKQGVERPAEVCLGGKDAFHPEATRYYLKQGLVKADAQEKSGLAPLHCAAQRGLVAYAKLLLKHGAKVNVTDKKGKTPLHYACSAGQTHLAMVSFLLQKGAKLNAGDKKGRPPYYYAKDLKLRIFLLKKGVPADSPNIIAPKPTKACKGKKSKDLTTCLINHLEKSLQAISPRTAPPKRD